MDDGCVRGKRMIKGMIFVNGTFVYRGQMRRRKRRIREGKR